MNSHRNHSIWNSKIEFRRLLLSLIVVFTTSTSLLIPKIVEAQQSVPPFGFPEDVSSESGSSSSPAPQPIKLTPAGNSESPGLIPQNDPLPEPVLLNEWEGQTQEIPSPDSFLPPKTQTPQPLPTGDPFGNVQQSLPQTSSINPSAPAISGDVQQAPGALPLQAPNTAQRPLSPSGEIDSLPPVGEFSNPPGQGSDFQQMSNSREVYSPPADNFSNSFDSAPQMVPSPGNYGGNSSAVQVEAAKVRTEEVHEIQSGENYWTLSRKYYGAARYFAALAEYNRHRIPHPDRMKPGMYVLIPDVSILEERYPEMAWINKESEERAKLPGGFFIDESGRPAYRIGKGDTLTDIAQNHLGRMTRWTEIHKLNQDVLGARGILKIGMVLRLPPDACQVSLAPPVGNYR
ncbi:LysM domain/BON superfamily protein [Thalassoglobus neptunius]|uniref:LysM domain/BON superfamily protein n=1 Tax=Thalassoglobus neptunius TaxID=1938619 RepID=A0A5C5X6V4_9PLAN|nr:LysM peptidoglycan-binding domain-containing protein [Thalassoglobus neptunius]TWT57742.1 LysM domain/BON superfamily protein [Thalassoglobus neptunius]